MQRLSPYLDTNKQTDRQTDKQTNRQTDRQTNRHTDKQMDIDFIASMLNNHQGHFKVQKLTQYLIFGKNAKMRKIKKRFKKS